MRLMTAPAPAGTGGSDAMGLFRRRTPEPPTASRGHTTADAVEQVGRATDELQAAFDRIAPLLNSLPTGRPAPHPPRGTPQ